MKEGKIERKEKMNKNTNIKIYILGYKVKREWEQMNKRIDWREEKRTDRLLEERGKERERETIKTIKKGNTEKGEVKKSDIVFINNRRYKYIYISL